MNKTIICNFPPPTHENFDLLTAWCKRLMASSYKSIPTPIFHIMIWNQLAVMPEDMFRELIQCFPKEKYKGFGWFDGDYERATKFLYNKS